MILVIRCLLSSLSVDLYWVSPAIQVQRVAPHGQVTESSMISCEISSQLCLPIRVPSIVCQY